MKDLFLLILLFAAFSLQGQKISSEEALEDLHELKKAIQTYNPALEIYNPDYTVNTDQLLREVPADSLSFIRYFQFVSRLCALSNEGHFALGNWQDTFHSGFLENRYAYLPVSIRILSGEIYVWKDYTDEQLMNRGEKIISINRNPAGEILSELYEHLPGDGSIMTYADRMIEFGFSWMYYFYVEQPQEFKMLVAGQDGKTKTISVKALQRDQQFENVDTYYPRDENDRELESEGFYDLNYDGDVAFLSLSSFDYRKIEKYDVKANKMYKSLFQELSEKEVNYLVIDLRGNTGGRNEFADEMVPYIYREDFQNPFLRMTVSWKGKKKTYKLPNPSKLVFQGDLYVLVDGRTYSNGHSLARYLKEYGRATIIGEETGTRYEGYVAGSKQYITLPYSGIRIGIPRYHMLFPPSKKQQTTNRGLLPDHIVTYTVDDLMEERDKTMETVRLLLE